MGKVKKIIVGVLVTTLVAGGAAGGLMYMKQANQKEVLVTGVGSLASEYYMPSTTLEGHITTNVSQSVTVDKDMIIQEVYVQKGDSVSKGDKLISFDMTLVEMELKIAKLKREKQEQDLNKAVNRLNSLQNGGPIEESDGASPGNADNLNAVDKNEMDNQDGDDELSSIGGNVKGSYLAGIIRPLLLAASLDDGSFSDGTPAEEASPASGDDNMEASQDSDESEDTAGNTQGNTMEGPTFQDPSANDFGSGEEPEGGFDSEVEEPNPSPTPTPELDADTDFFNPYPDEETTDFTDGEVPFYQKLDAKTEPYTGTGTQDDPYVFLCSSIKGQVTVMGSFFNKMAGYSEDGSKIVKEGGSWFQLEFHQNDTIADPVDRKNSCIGYYLIDGSLLEKPVYMYTESEFTLEGASHYEEELPPDDGNPGGNEPVSTMTREEAIKVQKNKISSLKIDLQESDIKITKLEKKVSRQMVYSKLDGAVTYVGDAVTGTSEGNAFIKIKSKDGFYVKGSVSELMLDQIKEGTTLNCMSYESGNFDAEVVDVSDYPVSSDSNNYYGDGNPNVSYYTYSATISDKSIKLNDQEWITVTLKSTEAEAGSFVLSKAFVRTVDGTSFVYKDDNGILKKQIVNVGSSVDGGYSVLIKGGITKDDKIAFPYGKTVQEGSKTREVTSDEFYGY